MNLTDFFTGSRKFTIMALILVAAVIFRITKLLESSDFANLISGTGVAFMGSNAVEHIMGSVKDFIAFKASKGEDDE